MVLEKCCGAYPGYVCDGCPTVGAARAGTATKVKAAEVTDAFPHGACSSCQLPWGIIPPVRIGLTCGTCRRTV